MDRGGFAVGEAIGDGFVLGGLFPQDEYLGIPAGDVGGQGLDESGIGFGALLRETPPKEGDRHKDQYQQSELDGVDHRMRE
jgi:hypothetical protein